MQAVTVKKVNALKNTVNAMQPETSADKTVTALIAKTVELIFIFLDWKI